jgi:site-specific recombinase XerD
MTASVEAALARWLAERPGGPGALFPGESGSARGLSTRRIAELMDRVGERAGVAFSPHQLRHSFASRLVRAGVDVVAVAELLGHNSLQYVATYSRPTEAALRAILDAVETPRGPG